MSQLLPGREPSKADTMACGFLSSEKIFGSKFGIIWVL